MAGDVDNSDVAALRIRTVEGEVGEAEVYRDAACFFFRQTIRIGSGERVDECAFAVIDVTGSRDDEMSFRHSSW